MEVRKGYKQTEAGLIPDDWLTMAIAKMVEASSPICYGVVQVGKHREDGVPIVAIKFVKEIASAPLHRTASSLEEPYARSRLRAGDVLISIKGTIGRVGIVPSGFKGNISRELARLRISNETCSEYVAHQLEAGVTQERIMKSVVGTTRLEFSIATLRQFLLPLPPTKDEQRAIASALSDVDALLSALDHLIAKKRDLKQAAMQQLLTGQPRLPGFEGEWKVVRLSDVCSMRSGEGITSADINDFSPYPCYGGNGLRGYTSRFTHDGGFALIGRQGALCGNVVGVAGRFFASEHAVVVTPFLQTDIRWLTYSLTKMKLNQYSESSAQPGLSVSKVLMLDLHTPPSKDEQTAIAAILSDMDAELADLEARREKTRLLKLGMMQELLTGKTRLITSEPADA